MLFAQRFSKLTENLSSFSLVAQLFFRFFRLLFFSVSFFFYGGSFPRSVSIGRLSKVVFCVIVGFSPQKDYFISFHVICAKL